MKKTLLILVTVVLFGLQGSAQQIQSGWYYCTKCSMLSFKKNPGKCAGGGAHQTKGSWEYSLYFDGSPCNGQANWAYCAKCSCLFWGTKDFVPNGVCPKGGTHGVADAASYVYATCNKESGITFDDTYQEGWKYCSKCKGLFYGENAGKCAAGGAHEVKKSLNYVLMHDNTVH